MWSFSFDSLEKLTPQHFWSQSQSQSQCSFINRLDITQANNNEKT